MLSPDQSRFAMHLAWALLLGGWMAVPTRAKDSVQPDQTSTAPLANALRSPEPLQTPTARRLRPESQVLDGVKINFTSIADLNLDIAPKRQGENDRVPRDFAHDFVSQLPPVHYGAVTYTQTFTVPSGRAAGLFCHGPLYFEELNLERYGHHFGLAQPAISAAHFFATVPALPYLTAAHRPYGCYDCDLPYEAGLPAPFVWRRPKLSAPAGLLEAGVVTGLIFLIP